MLKSLELKNFTVFLEANLEFGKHLNVFVGENGTGKTHILKVAYSVLAVSAQKPKDLAPTGPTKTYLQKALADKIRGVFRPDEIGRMVSRKQGLNRSEVKCRFSDGKQDLTFSFNTRSKTEVNIDLLPQDWVKDVPVYLPTRELLSIAPGFITLYDSTHIPFEETWRDTASLLQAYPAKGPREGKIRELLTPLEAAMDGKIDLDGSGRFFLRTTSGNIEIHLVAEGLRKLAMIARLIATGSLLGKGTLFWDEPESNLNPVAIKAIARTILQIAKEGIQVYIATHSLFLLRELYILQQSEFTDLDSRYFGLHRSSEGVVTIDQGESIDSIGDIAVLDEELVQSQRYLEIEEELGDTA